MNTQISLIETSNSGVAIGEIKKGMGKNRLERFSFFSMLQD